MRAQVSVDFIIALTVMMSLFFLIFGLYAQKKSGIETVMANLEAKRIGEKLAWNINEVSRGGDGAREEVIIPERAWVEDYYIYIEGRWVEVVWTHRGLENHMAFPIMTSNIEGGEFDAGSSLVITNNGGVIEIS